MHPRSRSEGAGGGGVSWGGGDKARLQEVGAGSSPAGGDALTNLSHSLGAGLETPSPVIIPPKRQTPPLPGTAGRAPLLALPQSRNEKWKWEAAISALCIGKPAALGTHINLYCNPLPFTQVKYQTRHSI